ncbi:MAG: GNAT family N-acetyltransferase [Flavobacteriaceae bacterium]
MEVTVIKNIEELRGIKDQWEILENKSCKKTIYNSYQFLYNWVVHQQANFENLAIICIHERNEIVGIAPLMLTNEKALKVIRYKKLSFLGKGDFLNFLIESRPNTKPIIAKIFDSIHKLESWDKMDLTHLTKDSNLVKFLLRSSVYNSATIFFGENPVVYRNKHIDFLAYKKLHVRKNVNNYYNKLRKNFDVNVKLYWGDDSDILTRISKIHIERNSDGKNRKSLFEHLETMSFLRSIYEEGKITLTFCLENEHDIIAYVTCFIENDVIYVWNNSYNIKYEKFSPGDIIYMEAMKYFFGEKSQFNAFDFGGGRYPWKFQMTDDFISMYRLNLNNNKSKKYKLLEQYDKLFQIGKILFKS